MAEQVTTVVHAAGGVVWRPLEGSGVDSATADGCPADRLEIVLVHRPRYDDWSLPKGKLDPGEHVLTAAVREVYEETLVQAVPQGRLPRIRYLTGQPGVEKVVDYWSMRAQSWTFRPADDEIEQVGWFPLKQAAQRLSYVHDRGVVRAFADAPPVGAVVVLVRHGSAGERGSWAGPDEQRPLDDAGVAQSRALAEVIRLFEPEHVLSATPARCRQTVEPLGLPVQTESVFDEDADPDAAVAALRRIARGGGVWVVCSQGDLIPPVLSRLTGRANPSFVTAKGTGWVLTFSGERLTGHDQLTVT